MLPENGVRFVYKFPTNINRNDEYFGVFFSLFFSTISTFMFFGKFYAGLVRERYRRRENAHEHTTELGDNDDDVISQSGMWWTGTAAATADADR